MIIVFRMSVLLLFTLNVQANFTMPEKLKNSWEESKFFDSSIKVFKSKNEDLLMVGVPRNIREDLYKASLEKSFETFFKEQWDLRLKSRSFDKIKTNHWELARNQDQFAIWIDYQYEENGKAVFVTEYHKITNKNWFELSFFKNSAEAKTSWNFDKSKQLLSQVQIQ